MKLYIQDNNLYYYHYKIFKGQLSLRLLMLLSIIFFFNKNFLKYISYASLSIPVIGNYEGYLTYKKYNLIGLFFGSILIHMLFLYPLINLKKYFKPNFLQFLMIILGLCIIYFLPYWPYSIPRKTMAIMLLFTYVYFTVMYCYYFDYKFSNFLH